MQRPRLLEASSVVPFVLRLAVPIVVVLVRPLLVPILSSPRLYTLVPAFFILALLVLFAFPEFLREEGDYISFLLGFAAAVLAPVSTTSGKFYEATAQIVPVLFVALAIESRAFHIRSTRANPRLLKEVFTAVPALALAIAGFESLRVIVVGDASRGSFDLVVGALVAAGSSLTISAFVGRPHAEESQPDTSGPPCRQ